MSQSAAAARISLGLDAGQLREFVVRPALKRINLWSPAAENLVLGTCLHESHARYLDQLTPGPGPAYGLWQMERATYEDLWRNFIPGDSYLRLNLLEMAGFDSEEHPPVQEMHGNLFYAAAMCRVHYRRVREALPVATDAQALAEYWKRYYNTALGKGTVAQALPAFMAATA